MVCAIIRVTRVYIRLMYSERFLEGSTKPQLRQTCGWPLISDQRSNWTVLAVPIYAAEGCQNHLYSSVIVVGVSTM